MYCACAGFFVCVFVCGYRSVECPTIFSSDSSMSKLFEYITTSESASLLVVSNQLHLLPSYLERIKLSEATFAGLILDSLQQQFGVRVEAGTEANIKSSKTVQSQDLASSLTKIFTMFTVRKAASDAGGVDGLHHASKVAFATKNESAYTMSFDEWMHAVEYLELMDDTEDQCITWEDAASIFAKASGSDLDAEISMAEFRHALIEVGKRLHVQLNDMVHRSLHIAQLHKLFNFYAAGAKVAGEADGGSGAVGQRARTLDIQEFTKMLDHLGLSRKLSRHDQFNFFRLSQQASKARRTSDKRESVAGRKDASFSTEIRSPLPVEKTRASNSTEAGTKDFDVPHELDFFAIKWCVRAMAEHLKTDLDHLLGQTLDSFFANDQKVEEVPQYVINIASLSKEEQENFIKQCMRISELLCEIAAYEGCIDVAELMLKKCYDIENFLDIGNAEVDHVYGSSEDIIHTLAVYSRCAYKQTIVLSRMREEMKERSEDLTNSIEDTSLKETQRQKQLAMKRMTVALRREDEELHAAYVKKSEKLQKELSDVQRAMVDNTNQLRWMRRRASTAGQVREWETKRERESARARRST